ncbi:MAG: hypothetical protein QOH51_1572 [Acidobacteriota bacterium]|jgi:hypothetical protein|nr:hypothetical protein [Acidobacteriota bacterium]
MKKSVFVYACVTATVLALSLTARAQTEAPKPSPTPVDSFGGDLLITDWKARLDSFAVDLQNAPGSRGYIIAYSDRQKLPGWTLRRANQVISYLTVTRGVEEGRVSVVSGGFRASAGYEFWVISPGEQLPVKPLDFSLAFAGEKSPVLFDRYYLFSRWEDWGEDGNLDVYTRDHGRFEPFVSFLRADPSLRGCVITYATRHDRRGADRRLAASEKRAVLTTQSVMPDRIVSIAGGLRPHKTVELWLVPPGAELPRPTPVMHHTRRKRR